MKQDCIPAGCVPPVAVAVPGVSSRYPPGADPPPSRIIIIFVNNIPDYINLILQKNSLNSILTSNYSHTITKPTRITKNTATLIDNITVGIKHQGNCESVIGISVISDHLPTHISTKNIHPVNNQT